MPYRMRDAFLFIARSNVVVDGCSADEFVSKPPDTLMCTAQSRDFFEHVLHPRVPLYSR